MWIRHNFKNCWLFSQASEQLSSFEFCIYWGYLHAMYISDVWRYSTTWTIQGPLLSPKLILDQSPPLAWMIPFWSSSISDSLPSTGPLGERLLARWFHWPCPQGFFPGLSLQATPEGEVSLVGLPMISCLTFLFASFGTFMKIVGIWLMSVSTIHKKEPWSAVSTRAGATSVLCTT